MILLSVFSDSRKSFLLHRLKREPDEDKRTGVEIKIDTMPTPCVQVPPQPNKECLSKGEVRVLDKEVVRLCPVDTVVSTPLRILERVCMCVCVGLQVLNGTSLGLCCPSPLLST